jgi:hypothetical protein
VGEPCSATPLRHGRVRTRRSAITGQVSMRSWRHKSCPPSPFCFHCFSYFVLPVVRGCFFGRACTYRIRISTSRQWSVQGRLFFFCFYYFWSSYLGTYHIAIYLLSSCTYVVLTCALLFVSGYGMNMYIHSENSTGGALSRLPRSCAGAGRRSA